MNDNVRTRALMLASFEAACRVAKGSQTVALVPASAAGLLLSLFGTARHAFDACSKLPLEGPWPAAAKYLAALVIAEMADTVPPESREVAR